mmetsp:Transcript_45014/g.73357  ORF Transcript_45014/g.73357 Transcript_45014/m.73357 type:complete len:86 (+) Transcript_45014:607-864(+)
MQPGWSLYYARSPGEESCGTVVGPSPKGIGYLAIQYEREAKMCLVASANPLLVCHRPQIQATSPKKQRLTTHGPCTVQHASNTLV